MRPHVREGGAASESVKEHDMHIESTKPKKAYVIKNALHNIFTWNVFYSVFMNHLSSYYSKTIISDSLKI